MLSTYVATFPRSLRRRSARRSRCGCTRSCGSPSLDPQGARALQGPILFAEHHSVARGVGASCVSPFEEAAILTVDGVGEWATATFGRRPRQRHRAVQGDPLPALAGAALQRLHLLPRLQGQQRRVQGDGRSRPTASRSTLRPDHEGAGRPAARTARFKLNMKYFAYDYGLTHDQREPSTSFFGGPPRERRVQDGASASSDIAATRAEGAPRRSCCAMVRHLHQRDRARRTCAWRAASRSTASPTAASSARRPFKQLFVQPAAGDAGGARRRRRTTSTTRVLRAARAPPPGRTPTWGPEFSDDEIRALPRRGTARVPRRCRATSCSRATAQLIAESRRGRLVPGPHGVRPARARRPQHPRRPAQPRRCGRAST